MAKRNTRYADYDYEYSITEAYEASEILEEKLRQNKGVKYQTKEVQSGQKFEVEIIPFFKQGELPLGFEKREKSLAVKQDLNDRNSAKRFDRLLNANFKPGDDFFRLSYHPQYLPATIEEVEADLAKFHKRVNYRWRKTHEENIKWMRVIEGYGGQVRFHIHLVLEAGFDVKEIQKIWGKGQVQWQEVYYKEGHANISSLAAYMTKNEELANEEKVYRQRPHKRAWSCSRGNLIDPEKTAPKPKQKFRRRQVVQMALDFDSIKENMERKYPDKYYVDAKVKFNKFNGLCYIYVHMQDRLPVRRC